MTALNSNALSVDNWRAVPRTESPWRNGPNIFPPIVSLRHWIYQWQKILLINCVRYVYEMTNKLKRKVGVTTVASWYAIHVKVFIKVFWVSKSTKYQQLPLCMTNRKGCKFLDEPCYSHVGKFVEVFCLDHDKPCCSVCFATQHRHCKRVEALEDIAEGMPKSNIDWNIEVLIKIAKITKETIEYKEQTIKETNARRKRYWPMLMLKLKISNLNLMNVNNSLRRRS